MRNERFIKKKWHWNIEMSFSIERYGVWRTGTSSTKRSRMFYGIKILQNFIVFFWSMKNFVKLTLLFLNVKFSLFLNWRKNTMLQSLVYFAIFSVPMLIRYATVSEFIELKIFFSEFLVLSLSHTHIHTSKI